MFSRPGYTVNANANWNGSDLVQTSGNNIIFVNFNYRVSLWGFLAGEEVRADGDLNVGLLDQRFLMHWVQQHIAQVRAPPPVVRGVRFVALRFVSAQANNVSLAVTQITSSFRASQQVQDLSVFISSRTVVVMTTYSKALLPNPPSSRLSRPSRTSSRS